LDGVTTAPWPDHLLSLTEWDTLTDDPGRRYELIEGVLIVVPRPAPLHQRVMVRLAAELDRQLPDILTALADVEVVIDAVHPATVRVPDVVVVPTRVAERNPPRLDAADVLLAVEIISPGTRRTDRVTKLTEYADAGIAAYWLVDLDPPTTLTAYTLVDGDYEIAAEGTADLTLLSPAEVQIRVERLTTRR
jgi:Uma2 family endonuclease